MHVRDGRNSNPVESILVCFMCKHCNPVQNILKYNFCNAVVHIFYVRQCHWTSFQDSCMNTLACTRQSIFVLDS